MEATDLRRDNSSENPSALKDLTGLMSRVNLVVQMENRLSVGSRRLEDNAPSLFIIL